MADKLKFLQVRHQILGHIGLSEHHLHFGFHLEGPVYGLEQVVLESNGVVGLIVHLVQNFRHRQHHL